MEYRMVYKLAQFMAALSIFTLMPTGAANATAPTARLHSLRVAPDRDLLIDDRGRVVVPPVGRHVGDTAAGHAFIVMAKPDDADLVELRDRATGAVMLSLATLDQAEGGRSKMFAGRPAIGAPVSVWSADGKLLAQLPPDVLGKKEGTLDRVANMFKPKKPALWGIDGEGSAGFGTDAGNFQLFPNGWQVPNAEFKSTYFKGDGVWIGFRKNGGVSLFDVDRRTRIDTDFSGISYFAKTLIASRIDDKRRRIDYWIIDRTGKPIAGPFDDISNFDVDRALVLKGLKYEALTIPTHDRFDGASGYLYRDPPSRPLVRVIDPATPPPKEDAPEIFGYSDVSGALALPIKHTLAEQIPKDGVYAWREWQWGTHKGNYDIVIDGSGKKVMEAWEPDSVTLVTTAKGWPNRTSGAVLSIADKTGVRLYSVAAKTYTEPVKHHSDLHGERMSVTTSKGAGLIDRKAQFVAPPIWPTLANSGNLWAFAPADDTGLKPDGTPVGYIDATGQVIARLARACGMVIVVDGAGQRLWPTDSAPCSDKPELLTHAPK